MPTAKATHSTTTIKRQRSFDTDLTALDETIEQLEALSLMLGDTLDASTLSPSSAGMVGLFRRLASELRFHYATIEEDLRKPAFSVERVAGHLTTADVPTDAERLMLRREYIGLIMRDTDTTRVCEAYAIPKETLRDILYALIDAPQKVHTHEGDGLRTAGSGNLSEGPIPDHFREEAIIGRLTGDDEDGREAV